MGVYMQSDMVENLIKTGVVRCFNCFFFVNLRIDTRVLVQHLASLTLALQRYEWKQDGQVSKRTC